MAASVAEVTGTQATYSRSKGMDKACMKQVVLDYLDRFTTTTRAKIDELLIPLLPTDLSDKQKQDRVKNLLSELSSKDQKIVCEGRGPRAVWQKRPAED